MRWARAVACCLLLLGAPFLLGSGGKTSIVETKHNLSASGRGEIKAFSETRICIFCHSSHNSSREGPLWNHLTTSPDRFKTYQRSSLLAQPEQPNGATKLCLSCHDGTIAVGATHGATGTIAMRNVGSGGGIPHGNGGFIGTDLSGTHPVSIRVTETMASSKRSLRWPPLDPEHEVGLDANGYVQCTSCHDPHGSRSVKYPFWRKETFDQVCEVCHAY